MKDPSSGALAIENFAKEIGRLHERRIVSTTNTLRRIADPETEHDRALSSYYSRLDSDQRTLALVSQALESLLHDLFFLLDENEGCKIVLDSGHGETINLAEAVDVIQAFPLDSVERYSAAGLEMNRQTDYLSKELNLMETRQERRARILKEKAETKPSIG